MGVNSLPKTVTRQRRGCDLNGDAENAGLENAGKRGTKSQGWKRQDWKTREHHVYG